jgi:hypothetical protein
MEATVGTRSWSLVTTGALRNQDRRRLVAQAVLSKIAAVPAASRARLGLNDRALARIDVAAIRMPDSKAAIHAEELMKSLSAPWLVNHCMRTWLWGVMFAQAGNIRFDEELYFVASVLHDLGLTDEQKCGDGCTACFAVQGARMAEQFAGRQGWSAERQHRLSDAIVLHMNARVSIAHGAEAHLLHQGAALDVVGARMAEIGQPARQTVLEKYPRLGFKKTMSTALKEQAILRPSSRAAFFGKFGFHGMIRDAGWTD